MSLRGFHLAFLAAALATSLWLCAWAMQRWTAGDERTALVIAGGAMVAAVAIALQTWWVLGRWRGEER